MLKNIDTDDDRIGGRGTDSEKYFIYIIYFFMKII